MVRARSPYRVALSAAVLFTCVAVPACRSPEDRAMDQMERQMRANTKMMKRMEKMMEENVREMERDE
jgi:Zn-dependent membrane protease YugP